MKANPHLMAEEAFQGFIQFTRTYEIDASWLILVNYSDAEGAWYCELFRVDNRSIFGWFPAMRSAPFRTAMKALLWAHRFDVPVNIDSEELYADE